MPRSTHNHLATAWARPGCPRVRRWGRLIGLLMLAGVSLAVTACGHTPTPPVTSGTGTATPGTDELPVLSSDEAIRQDAQEYARQFHVSVEEAVERLQYQAGIEPLCEALTANEKDTFAGLWIQHEPEYRVIVRFTRDGAETIRPYIEGQPFAHLVEVREARFTRVELKAIMGEALREMDKLDFGVAVSLSVPNNRVEVGVTDRAWFEAELREAGAQLPEGVELVVVEGRSAKGIDICATPPVPGVAFPRQKPVEGIVREMVSLLIGDLVLVDGCLRVNSIYRDTSYLPVWPPEFTLGSQDGEIQVLDGAGQVVARVGQEVRMGGGGGSATSLADCVRQQLPADCVGPYWFVGAGVRPNLKYTSDLFTLDVISTTERSFFWLRRKSVLDEWVENTLLTGELVLFDRCPRILTDDHPDRYLPLWPPDYGTRVADGEVEIVDGSGQVVARIGEEVRLSGGKIPVDWDSEAFRRLYHELPGDCDGPYWIVGGVTR